MPYLGRMGNAVFKRRVSHDMSEKGDRLDYLLGLLPPNLSRKPSIPLS